ncbi:unnamed protein product [Owenia fusiformis]|uniref:Uncharacterized protein n=1 Tax=Owenia fusiformis TaxID=6347 RepID=A0A8S4NLI1_OWEFU|nr:unnamed protein product [Owenia fusiformis]
MKMFRQFAILGLFVYLGKTDSHASNSDTSTLQSCVLKCLGNDIFGCISEPEVDSHKAYFMNTLIDNCFPESDIGQCFEDTFLQEAGTWCEHLRERDDIANQINTCYTDCSANPISVPRQNAVEFETEFKPMELTSEFESERSEYVAPQLEGICKDSRFRGFLCSEVMANATTAGNSLCRPDHRCGFHEEAYYWCFTTLDDDWDYCCTGACDYHAEDFLHCESGSEWQFCGDAGTVTTGHRQDNVPYNCRSDHPCGLHRDTGDFNYYWCFVDSTSWDYCCSPREYDHLCDFNRGAPYRWCKYTYHRDYILNEWAFCTPMSNSSTTV